MRQLNEVIFMGNGLISAGECYKMIERLQEGFSILSALQQPDHPQNEKDNIENKKWRKKAQRDLDDVILDIRIALGDKDKNGIDYEDFVAGDEDIFLSKKYDAVVKYIVRRKDGRVRRFGRVIGKNSAGKYRRLKNMGKQLDKTIRGQIKAGII